MTGATLLALAVTWPTTTTFARRQPARPDRPIRPAPHPTTSTPQLTTDNNDED